MGINSLRGVTPVNQSVYKAVTASTGQEVAFMPSVRISLCLSLSALLLSACAYAPESAAPSWTDAQLEATAPGNAPAFVREERLDRNALSEIAAAEHTLVSQRDRVKDCAADIPALDGASEDFAAEARERGTPPDNPN